MTSSSRATWDVARKGGEREERGQYEEVRTRDERDASCRERRQPPAEASSAGREPEASRGAR